MAINLNGTTPAAPAGNSNVTWQEDGSGNVSAYVPTSVVEGSKNDYTAQTANIGSTNIFAVTATGRFRVSVYIVLTTVAGVSSTLPAVNLAWTDGDTSFNETLAMTATSNANTVGTFAQASAIISAQAASNISFSTSGYASSPGATMQYAVHIITEIF